jgi:predicted Zn-dependent protease
MRKIISVVLLLITIPSFFQCGKLVESAADWFVSDEEEVAMGDNLYAQIVADTDEYPLIDTVNNQKHKLLGRYIDSIGDAIQRRQTARPENEHLKYTFSVIDKDKVVNAFAIPGGHMFFYTGLIKEARNEAEIAGVIAHELAHITQRHGVQQLVKLAGIEYVQKLIFGNDPNILTEAAKSLLFLKFSRENEYEADSCSTVFLTSAGYNPDGMQTFLELLAQNSGWSFEPLSTHPDTEKRIEAVKRIIGSNPSGAKPPNQAVVQGWITGKDKK